MENLYTHSLGGLSIPVLVDFALNSNKNILSSQLRGVYTDRTERLSREKRREAKCEEYKLPSGWRIWEILFLFVFILTVPRGALAQEYCTDWKILDENGNSPPFYITRKARVNYSFKLLNYQPSSSTYTVNACYKDRICYYSTGNLTPDNTGMIKGHFVGVVNRASDPILHFIQVDLDKGNTNPICTSPEIEWRAEPTPTPAVRADCILNLIPNQNIHYTDPLRIDGNIINNSGFGANYNILLGNQVQVTGPLIDKLTFFPITGDAGNKNHFTADIGSGYRESLNPYTVTAYISINPDTGFLSNPVKIQCTLSFRVPSGMIIPPTPIPIPTPPPIPRICVDMPHSPRKCPVNFCGKTEDVDCNICPGCPGYQDPNKPPSLKIPNLKPLCQQLPQEYQTKCETCKASGKIWSAIGCIPTDMSQFLEQYVFKFGPGIAGGIAFLYFLYGAFLILTSTGDPEKVNEGKEVMVSAISGLLLIIFSVFLLRVVAQDILNLPEFGP